MASDVSQPFVLPQLPDAIALGRARAFRDRL